MYLLKYWFRIIFNQKKLRTAALKLWWGDKLICILDVLMVNTFLANFHFGVTYSFWATLAKRKKKSNNLPKKTQRSGTDTSQMHTVKYMRLQVTWWHIATVFQQHSEKHSDAIVSWTKIFENKNNPEYPCMANRKNVLNSFDWWNKTSIECEHSK